MSNALRWNSIRLLAFLLVFLGACGGQSSQALDDASAAWRTTEGAVIKARIRTAYQVNRHLNSLRIEVDTEGRHVTLRGVVPSRIQKDLAGEIALKADGVRSVKNELRVSGTTVAEPAPFSTVTQASIDAGPVEPVRMALYPDRLPESWGNRSR